MMFPEFTPKELFLTLKQLNNGLFSRKGVRGAAGWWRFHVLWLCWNNQRYLGVYWFKKKEQNWLRAWI